MPNGEKVEFQQLRKSKTAQFSEMLDRKEFIEIEEFDSMNDIVRRSMEGQQTKINISMIEYIRGFFSFDKKIAKKMEMLKEGERRIRERLDIFNVMIKLREIDKLKAILLNKD
mmetsp:Transcript_28917/g.26264  ORF Transcript_28917/g.26264 Transcript_28917/m.26264 type:complete len:113 (-) Transcript_28917:246-584(-)